MRAAELDSWMLSHHGIAHSSVLRSQGFTEHDVRRAISAGVLRRVRRSWLVAPSCDHRRVSAASAGGRATCVTAAALRGLWTPAHEHTHVAVASTTARVDRTGLRVHWSSGPVALPASTAEEHPINMLFHVAKCLPPAEALAVWESALRRKVVEPEVLRRVKWRSPRARELASVASVLSDSGVESHFLDLMRSVGVQVRQQVWIDGHPVDGLIGRALAIQLDGFAHHSTAQDRRRDLRADARLTLLGYTVIRFDYQQVLFDHSHVIDTVLTAIAQGLDR
ncbi:DUF559 domain-containing protein [Micromonospora sp. DT81.3]|uniref:DUF559 domain-containing protein n=1 Tax=Micromonospora sp. DT81.3 TaxID=3416523 RepID=UPI003CE8F05B